jgi:hypothetical protein
VWDPLFNLSESPNRYQEQFSRRVLNHAFNMAKMCSQAGLYHCNNPDVKPVEELIYPITQHGTDAILEPTGYGYTRQASDIDISMKTTYGSLGICSAGSTIPYSLQGAVMMEPVCGYILYLVRYNIGDTYPPSQLTRNQILRMLRPP